MSAKYAVIDLGTNTFHLLIAGMEGGKMVEYYRERRFVKLASEGIQKIGDTPYSIALDTMKAYQDQIAKHQVKTIKAIGTAALRTASNGPHLVADIKAATGIDIEVISGSEEARLISKGVQMALPDTLDDYLIMDIGGGSVEFIIVQNKTLRWAQSFPLGVAVLFGKFHHHDPISRNEVSDIHSHLSDTLFPLFAQLKNYPVKNLVGASGTFDVLEKSLAPKRKLAAYSQFPAQNFASYYQKLLPTTLAERLSMEDIPSSRADLIIVAIVLIEYILKKFPIENIYTSSYAMKEGILSEMIDR